MKELSLESKEFQRILYNLHLENITLSPTLQKRVIEIVNSGEEITPEVIKDALNRAKI
ncbi:Zn-dependent hydrolase [Gracilibacillus sp. YIM 98692]|uniref:Zn-dependent hydrolase n=1 Tax=Gracilibacillus sp. YIM 98692 TaxID=2663532 RepID=UPI0013D4DAB8|nr:Zn-dependent hydrolase [Gracilibacillus sp. YIM 98692]